MELTGAQHLYLVWNSHNWSYDSHNRLFAVKPSRDLLFIKLWAATSEECQKWKKHVENIKTAKFEAHGIKKMRFYDGLNLKKLRRFVSKKLLESKALLSSNYFHTNLLIFFQIQTTIKSHSFMLGTSNVAILVFSICSFHFWHSLSYSP